ncbi:TonB-dependent receptor [Mangrovimicrobium sediminis]|uniref:TonB-dependent receptor n=1 Tax=Mangrovimicrobium sediminis TaxID=2562682 RepID=A0A4Z0M188_9GAMM|nr:TonB-dependent receptor [Haliea sp. SAOS-164]TGD73372.1 TonB-dependent receptor [Haliea sp. SAOS-164]
MHTTSRSSLSLACTLACSTAFLAPTVEARQSGTSLALEEVIVTAQRKEQSANDVGMDIQSYAGESLEQLRVTDVEDLTRLVPAFTVAQSYQGVPTYTLRGIGFNTINISAKSSVGTYVDEVAYPYPVLNSGPVYDLQRVEVLKGPQGTLFGRNTTAGLINLVTNKPTQEFEAMLRGEVGNYDSINLEGVVSGPLGDRFGARLAVRSENSGEGWQKSNSRGERLGEVDRQGARLSLAWDPSDSLHIDFSYNWWRNQSDMLAAQAIGFTPSTLGSPFNAPGLIDYVAANQPNSADEADWAPRATRSQDIGIGAGLPGDLAQDSELNALALHVSADLPGEMRLVSLTGYHDLQRDGLTDFSGAPYELLIEDLEGEIESFSQELRLEGETGPANWLVGVYYAEDELLDSNRTLLGENANVALVRTYTLQLLGTPFNTGGYTAEDASQAFRTYIDRADIDARSWSVFANADWKLTDKLNLTTGIRYTEDEQDYAGCSRDFNGSMLPNVNVTNRYLYFTAYGVMPEEISAGECNTFHPDTGSFGIVESELNEDNVAWRLALNWWPGEDTLLYASVTQGAKSGETPVNPANLAEQNAPVTQEELLAYETGVKATLFDGRLQANASAFFYDYTDKQLNVYFADPIYTALPRLDNIPDSEAYGLDTELTWLVTEGLTAFAAATWLQTEIQDYTGINNAGEVTDYDGAEFLYSPDLTASLTFLYQRAISAGLGFNASLNARYQSDSYANLEGDDEYTIDAYNVVNASIGLGALTGNWDVSLWAENLTDEYYWLTVTQGANTVIRFPGKSRTYGATLTYRF